MSSVSGAAKKQPTRCYISSAEFSDSIFNYTPAASTPLTNTPGYLTALPGASGYCPPKRILRETGRKLYPATHSGVKTYMVNVMDSVNQWNGYIDPNSPKFALYSTDVPAFFANGVDAVTGTPADAGEPVITNGLVNAGLSVTAGSYVTAGTYVNATTFISSGTNIAAAGNIIAGKFFTSPKGSGVYSSGSPGTASCGQATLTAGVATVYTTAATPTSMVFVTVNNASPRTVSAVPATGSFNVYTGVSDASTFYWLIIN
jgi:hypothetical protein